MTNIIDRTGEISYNNFGSKIVIKEYRNTDDIDVYFEEYDWIAKNKRYDMFKKGKVKCPYEKTIFNIGYIGEGEYNVSINKKVTKHYKTWNSMLQRCYDHKYIERRPTYIGCKVCPEWHNFQNFAGWFEKNFYQIEGQMMNLDKDILMKGNKIYSPNTCVFVPQTINSLFIKCNKCRGDLPIGVIHRNKKYEAQCGVNGKPKHLGYYNTPEEAFKVYKQYKEDYIKKVAEEYKNVIPSKLYEAMLKYEVEIND